MGDVFVWTGFDAERKVVINTEQILFMERVGYEPTVDWIVHFEGGQTLELDDRTGHSLMIQLSCIHRPSPPTQYVPSKRLGDRPQYPHPRRGTPN